MIIYNFIKYLILSIKYYNIFKKADEEEGIIKGLSVLLGEELKKDWIGRFYVVLNPYIVDGKYDPSKQLYEIGEDSPSELAVEKYIMERMLIASEFIKNNNLFDLLTYDIKRLDEYDNFLFIIKPLPYAGVTLWGKRLLKLLAGIGVISIFIIYFWQNIIGFLQNIV